MIEYYQASGFLGGYKGDKYYEKLTICRILISKHLYGFFNGNLTKDWGWLIVSLN